MHTDTTIEKVSRIVDSNEYFLLGFCFYCPGNKMKTKQKRILFFAESVTLAHLARCLVLADALHATGRYTVALATDNRYDSIIGEQPYKRILLQSVSNEYFARQLSKGLPLYTKEQLADYVADDIKIIDDFQPDFIFGDFRLSLAVSCPLRGIPYATITNAYWSPYANIDYPVPELLLVKILGVSLAQKLFDLVRPIVFYLHAIPLNKVRKQYGLPSLGHDLRETYTFADFTLYADSEDLISMNSLPENHLFIGPVLWSASVDLPKWWEAVSTDYPVVLLILGSSGNSELLPIVLQALSNMPVSVICVTANKATIHENFKNVYIADYLPAELAVKRADLVICNGGSPMVYQCLAEHTPFIGLPGNLDQYLMMSLISAAKKGELIRSGKVNVENIRAAVSRGLQKNKIIPEEPLETVLDNLEKIEAIINKSTVFN